MDEFSFGNYVRQRRRELDLTQEELARRVGCAAITIRKIEAEDARPSVQIAERLAMALAIPLDQRAEFVRRARAIRPEPEPLPTPPPKLEEIGLEDLTGRAIRGYALNEKIGAGGMGAVYRAVQPIVEREVAIKIILPEFANHPDFIRRFEAEAQLVARLEHPHIVPLYDYWREPGVAYLVMRLLRGGSLQGLLQGGSLPVETVVRILEQICSALGTAHRIGVIHRDLKPANILLDEDQNAYLADFGIAKNLGNPEASENTEMGVIIGSPQYISPEQIRSLSVRPQTDIYCLGVMLYEMLTGKMPFTGPTPFDFIQQHISAPMPSLAANATGLPSALDAVIARATAKDPADRYADTATLLAEFHQAVSGLLARPLVLLEKEPVVSELTNPYKGLRAFGEADAEDFFGRETLVQQLLARLSEGGELARFLAVIGPSGSGKSSAVRAGLLPALRRGGLLGSENWFYVDLLPGSHPFEELEAALLRVAVNPPPSLLDQLKSGARGLGRAINRILPTDSTVELVLIIDQFEELFTLVENEEERALFLNSLLTACLDERSRVRIIITLRADFIDRPLYYVDFGELVQRRNELVLPLTPDELERAILSPARRVGLKLETGLVATILRDLGEQPGTLPLLQYALTELFDRREGNQVTKAAYQTIGGVLGALGRRAEEVFAHLNPEEQETARQVFLRLVTLGEGTEDTRRRVLRSELEQIAENRTTQVMLEAFGKSRLLSFDHDPVTRSPTVEVAHEAILREWPRLREWLREGREDVRLQRQLAQSAAEWQSARQEASYLLTGAHLAQFEGWAAGTSISLTGDERAFLEASIRERQRIESEEAARQRRELEAAQKLAETERLSALRLRGRNRMISMVGALALLFAILAGVFGTYSNQNAQQAEQQTKLATSRELAAAAINNLQTDPERSILLGLQAYSAADTLEARNALHQAIGADRLRINFQAHEKSVYGVAISPDGQKVATASLDGTVKVWGFSNSSLSNPPQWTLSDPIDFDPVEEGAGEAIAFSSDGRRLAVISGGQAVKMWDLASGQLLHTLTGHNANVYAVTFSPDGKVLASAGDDATIKLWDTATGQELQTLSENTGSVYSAAFSPDGKYLASAGFDKTVRVWNLRGISARGSQQVISLPVDDVAQAVVFSPDGERLAAGVGIGIRVWDLNPGAADLAPKLSLNLPGHGNAVISLSFSADGERLVSGGVEGNAKVWDANTGQELFLLAGGTGAISSIALSPDEMSLLTANVDGTLKLWDLTPAGNQEWFNVSGYNGHVSADGQHLMINISGLGTAFGEFQLWDLSSTGIQENRHLSLDPGGLVSAVAYRSDLSRIATIGVDAESASLLKIWAVDTGQMVNSFPLSSHKKVVFGLNFSPDGALIATGSDDGTARVWDTATGKELLLLSGHTAPIRSVVFSPDGKWLATGSYDGTARLWDSRTGQSLLTFSGHEAAVITVAFSADGARLATSSNDKTARVWDVQTGKEILTLRGHSSGVFSVAFSPDGKQITSGSVDGTTKVWDASNGQELLTFYGMRSEFTPNGKQLVAYGVDGVTRGFFLDMADLVTLAKNRLTRGLTVAECQKYLHMETCPNP